MEYIIGVLILVLIYIILATSLDIVFSNAGIFSVSHAAFFGMGALIYAVLSKLDHINYFIILVIVILVTSFVAVLIAISTLKIKGDYFIIASFGFQMIAYDIFYNWVRLTSGASVIYAIPKPTIFNINFDSTPKYLILVSAITVICVLICWRLSHSPFGNLLRAIKSDDIAVQASGRSPLVFKIKALVISGILAAIAGVLYSCYLTIFVPGAYDIDLSISIVAMVIVGGSGNIWGASLGATVLVILPQLISFINMPANLLGPLQRLFYGFLLIVFMRLRPEGLLKKRKQNAY
jgi:branched-chain amino acid transport system permease protein